MKGKVVEAGPPMPETQGPAIRSIEPQTPWPRPWVRGLLTDIGFCLLLGAALTGIFAPSSLERLLASFQFNSVMALCMGLSVRTLFRWMGPRLASPALGRRTRLLVYASLLVAGVTVGGEVGVRLIHAIDGPPPAETRAEAFRIGLILASIAATLCVAFERLREHARKTELRAQRVEQQALEAQLEALQARTNPHFVFNSLNSVAGLIGEDPKAAEQMIERLSGLFRYSLDQSKRSWVRLEEELGAARDYLDVERIRFGDRLRLTVDVEPGVEAVLVPPFILQPLVENAVLHGVASRRNGGRVSVQVARASSSLIIRVANDGAEAGSSERKGAGVALANLRDRLGLIYGPAATLESATAPDGGYCVTLSVPLVTAEVRS